MYYRRYFAHFGVCLHSKQAGVFRAPNGTGCFSSVRRLAVCAACCQAIGHHRSTTLPRIVPLVPADCPKSLAVGLRLGFPV